MLRVGRVHEASGGADLGDGRWSARVFAAAVAAAHDRFGAVIWIRRGGAGETGAEALDPYGLSALFDPARLLEVAAPTPVDALWAMEEALRSGAAPVVIAEPERRLDLTASRRLQLAAEAGGGLGLSLAPETAPPRSSAVETRWRATPVLRRAADDDDGAAPTAAWRWELLKNKRGPVGDWRVQMRAPAAARPWSACVLSARPWSARPWSAPPGSGSPWSAGLGNDSPGNDSSGSDSSAGDSSAGDSLGGRRPSRRRLADDPAPHASAGIASADRRGQS